MPQRAYTASSGYRFGFNGKLNDDEVFGNTATSQDYGMRWYNPRIGRFFSVDPLTKKYPELTPYQFASNNPIENLDVDGLEGADFKFEYAYSPYFIGGGGMTTSDKAIYQAAFDRLASTPACWMELAFNAPILWEGWFAAAHEITALQGIEAAGIGYTMYEGVAARSSEIKSGEPLIDKIPEMPAKTYTVTPNMSSAEKEQTRMNFAQVRMGSDFDKYAASKTINYNQQVFSTEIGPSTSSQRLVQWRDPSNPTASPFFTFDGVDSKTLGIPSTYTQKYYVELDKSYSFLQSTANDVPGWLPEDVGKIYKGGGSQLYCPDAAKNAKFIPAKTN